MQAPPAAAPPLAAPPVAPPTNAPPVVAAVGNEPPTDAPTAIALPAVAPQDDPRRDAPTAIALAAVAPQDDPPADVPTAIALPAVAPPAVAVDDLEALIQKNLASRANQQAPVAIVLGKHSLNDAALKYMEDYRWISIPHSVARDARRCVHAPARLPVPPTVACPTQLAPGNFPLFPCAFQHLLTPLPLTLSLQGGV